MDKKIRPLYMLCTRDPPQNKRHTQTEGEEMERVIVQMETNDNKAALASDKRDFFKKVTVRDK